MINDYAANYLMINFHVLRFSTPFLILTFASQMYCEVLSQKSERAFINVLKLFAIMKDISKI